MTSNWTESASGVPDTYTFNLSINEAGLQFSLLTWEKAAWNADFHDHLLAAFESFIDDYETNNPNDSVKLTRVYELRNWYQYPVPTEPEPDPEEEE